MIRIETAAALTFQAIAVVYIETKCCDKNTEKNPIDLVRSLFRTVAIIVDVDGTIWIKCVCV